MLRSLHLQAVGPAPLFALDLGERLNVLTGDNGLGKSFVLDVAWWALTGTWVGRPVLPQPGMEETAELAGEVVDTRSRPHAFRCRFDRIRQDWGLRFAEESTFTTLSQADWMAPVWIHDKAPTLYVRSDGCFSAWDPARNFRPAEDQRARAHPIVAPEAYHFTARELWDGLTFDGKAVCNGLIKDWVTWQLEADAGAGDPRPFNLLSRVLAALSHPLEPMRPGRPTRLFIDDVRKFPTIDVPYGVVPVIQASAGMQRILGLAYLVTWAWTEHIEACRLIGWEPASRFVMLIDEPETHLHPRWQRHLVPAVVQVLADLSAGMRPQVLMTTHSPLVLASIEPHFSAATDKQFLFELEAGEVTLRELPWVKRGDAIGWLTSEVFDLDQARSVEAERAIEAAEAYMRGELDALPEGLRTEDEIHRELVRLLPDQDRFWPRWIVRRERGGRG
ncbi:MAG TPA: ATP-binding protein [Candidatus Nanopelagicales bacterium]|nr:ATP-binding protein [Candidatus Nanopelagicales bacterium]